MDTLASPRRETQAPPSNRGAVLVATLACAASASWSFTRDVAPGRLVDVSPVRTMLPLVLFVLIALAGRKDPVHAGRVIGGVACVIVVLTAVVLPIAMNLAIDAGRASGAWPLDWLVPVRLHFRHG